VRIISPAKKMVEDRIPFRGGLPAFLPVAVRAALRPAGSDARREAALGLQRRHRRPEVERWPIWTCAGPDPALLAYGASVRYLAPRAGGGAFNRGGASADRLGLYALCALRSRDAHTGESRQAGVTATGPLRALGGRLGRPGGGKLGFGPGLPKYSGRCAPPPSAPGW
jgi:hypothetical protein